MNDKKEKLRHKIRKALNQYLGTEVGDVIDAEPQSKYHDGTEIYAIYTKPHKPSYKERRHAIFSQLASEIKNLQSGYCVYLSISQEKDTDEVKIIIGSGGNCLQLSVRDTGAVSIKSDYESYIQPALLVEVFDSIVDYQRKIKDLKQKTIEKGESFYD